MGKRSRPDLAEATKLLRLVRPAQLVLWLGVAAAFLRSDPNLEWGLAIYGSIQLPLCGLGAWLAERALRGTAPAVRAVSAHAWIMIFVAGLAWYGPGLAIAGRGLHPYLLKFLFSEPALCAWIHGRALWFLPSSAPRNLLL